MMEETYLSIFLSPSELFQHDNDDRSFVIGCDIICEILNIDILSKIKSHNHIKVRLQNIIF